MAFVTEFPEHLKQKCANPLCSNRFQARDVRQRYCADHRADQKVPDFIAIDGEGVGRGRDHKYVLLGVGDIQREWPGGVSDIAEVFEFLYECFERDRDAIYGGFYLGYDFNMWLRMLPRERAYMLLSKQGIAKRQRKSENGHYLGPFPVEYKGWQFDILADKRFKLKPKNSKDWLYICDHGPYFQTSLLKAVDPAAWNNPVINEEEYEILKRGKERRSEAVLDDDMRYYNRLENDILSRLMTHYRVGLAHASVTLKKQQWFGPGQAAQKWMRVVGTLDRPVTAVRERAKKDPAWWDAVVATYYGGWFEIMMHGHIPGESYEYDINSAYPYIASRLPCVCGLWKHGSNRPPKNSNLPVLVRCIARGSDKSLGGLPYRTIDNHVLRPRYTSGWYWYSEILAAKKAGLINDVTYYEWYAYQGCGHEPPMKLLAQLYENRLRIGKNTPEGKAFKLIYNSVYGKTCQSAGENTPFSNPVYASLITAGCRTMILDAIATHPDKAKAVAMVATDGVYFTSPHPWLSVSEKLGDWDTETHVNLTLFKPGVYWSDSARKAIAEGKAPQFKARGISAGDFAHSIASVDNQFHQWMGTWLPGMPPSRKDWPTVEFKSRFSQVTVRQAVQWTEEIKEPAKQNAIYRNLAGQVKEDKTLKQDSYPVIKRNPMHLEFDGRVWRSQPWDGGPHWPPSKPYDKDFGLRDDNEGFDGFMNPDGPVMQAFRGIINR